MAEPTPGQDASPTPRRRSSAALGAGAALLLGVPLAGFALKTWGPLLFPAEAPPRPVAVISGPRRLAAPAAPPENRASSIDLVRGDDSAAATPPPAAAPAAATAPSAPTPPAQQAPPEPAPAAPARKPYPKLRPNHGWKSWFARQGLQEPPQQQQTQARQIPTANAPAASPAPAAAASSGVSPASAPAAAAPAPKPARQGYKPPVPVYSMADQANQVTAVAPGAGLGAVDAPPPEGQTASGKRVWTEHSTFASPPDTAPEPNPEKPRTADGPCPRRGWWKSAYTGYCYYAQASCVAVDLAHKGCTQPNP